MKKFWQDFKKFISRGNVVDLAVAVVIGGAFGKIVSSLVSDIIMPLICAIFKTKDVSELAFKINSTPIYIGKFIQAIIDFLIIAFFIFLMIKLLTGMSDGVKNLKKMGKHELSKEERKELKTQGLTRKEIRAKEKEVRAEREKREAEEAAAKEAAKETTETLLRDIRELLKENNTKEVKKPKKGDE